MRGVLARGRGGRGCKTLAGATEGTGAEGGGGAPDEGRAIISTKYLSNSMTFSSVLQERGEEKNKKREGKKKRKKKRKRYLAENLQMFGGHELGVEGDSVLILQHRLVSHVV
jgi:hypothetical protein